MLFYQNTLNSLENSESNGSFIQNILKLKFKHTNIFGFVID